MVTLTHMHTGKVNTDPHLISYVETNRGCVVHLQTILFPASTPIRDVLYKKYIYIKKKKEEEVLENNIISADITSGNGKIH